MLERPSSGAAIRTALPRQSLLLLICLAWLAQFAYENARSGVHVDISFVSGTRLRQFT